MKSPFPGMDPFIEACGLWEDFHGHLVERIGETLADGLPPRYLVRTGERTYRAFRERFVEIHEADGDRELVTCIEVLSPSNKKPNSPGWELYQRKRQSLFVSHSANLIEIDLLRGGQAMPSVDLWPSSPYRLLVARRQRMPHCQVWDAHFDRPLPPGLPRCQLHS